MYSTVRDCIHMVYFNLKKVQKYLIAPLIRLPLRQPHNPYFILKPYIRPCQLNYIEVNGMSLHGSANSFNMCHSEHLPKHIPNFPAKSSSRKMVRQNIDGLSLVRPDRKLFQWVLCHDVMPNISCQAFSIGK